MLCTINRQKMLVMNYVTRLWWEHLQQKITNTLTLVNNRELRLWCEYLQQQITNTLTLVNNRGLRPWREYLQQKCLAILRWEYLCQNYQDNVYYLLLLA